MKHQLPPPDPRLFAEERISLTALAQRENVHAATTHRWGLRGISGHRLETFAIGHRRFTTVQAFERWLSKINGAHAPVGGGQSKHAETVDKRLAELGVK